MKIGVDLDDVLADTMPSLINYHNQVFGTSIVLEDVNDIKLYELFDCSLEEAVKRVLIFYESDHFSSIKPVDESVDAISKLYKSNELLVITSRHDITRDKTNMWLNKYFNGMFTSVSFSSHPYFVVEAKNKAEICLENHVDIMIDDFILYANECAEAGIKTLLLNRKWNENRNIHDNVHRVKSWTEIHEYIRSMNGHNLRA